MKALFARQRLCAVDASSGVIADQISFISKFDKPVPRLFQEGASSSLSLSSLDLSDTKVYEPQIRALLGIRKERTRKISTTFRRPNPRGMQYPPPVLDDADDLRLMIGPKPATRNPKPEFRIPKPETRNPKPETRDLKSYVLNPRFNIRPSK